MGAHAGVTKFNASFCGVEGTIVSSFDSSLEYIFESYDPGWIMGEMRKSFSTTILAVGFVSVAFYVYASGCVFRTVQPLQSISYQEDHPSFTELLIASGSDKYYMHHYERFYTGWLRPYRFKTDLKMLEIGVRDGKSMKLWQDYFVHAQRIFGLAYGVGSMKEADTDSNVEVILGDQSKGETMRLLQKLGPFDIIIDDGSHVPSHVIFTFFNMWSTIKPGGLYIIEDLETSYWKKRMLYGNTIDAGITADPQHSVVAKVKQFVDVLVRHQLDAQDELSVFAGDKEICQILFGMNVVAIYKCTEEERKMTPKTRAKSKVYNEGEMKRWVAEARASNPTGEDADEL